MSYRFIAIGGMAFLVSVITPDTRCTCEGSGGSDRGAGRGPATDPALMGKSTAVDHPQTPPATGPAVGLTDEGKLQYPQTPEATGPAR